MSDHLEPVLARASSRPSSEPAWDPDSAPADPHPLVVDWLTTAVDAGVLAANTATLATASIDGTPSARTVLVADITDEGLWFSTSSAGPAGRELAENPVAALVLYLREQSRQIRVTGEVVRGDTEHGAALFRRRGTRSRAVALAGVQSETLPPDADDLVDAARRRVEADDAVDPDYAAYLVRPTLVEFWQSRRESGEQRLRYRRAADEPSSAGWTAAGWSAERLWP